MVGHIYNKAKAPYLIASAFAALALIASGILAVAPYAGFLSPIAFNTAPPVALSLSILSVLVLVFSYKMISNNKKVEVEKNKFAGKEQGLAAKTQGLEGERREKEQLEKLSREKVEKLTQEKQALESRIEECLNRKVEQLKKQPTDAQQEDDSTKELNDEKEELLSKNVKLNMQVGQLKCEKNNFLHYTEELRDENTRLNEEKCSLHEKLYEAKKELSKLNRVLLEIKGLATKLQERKERARQFRLEFQEKKERIKQLATQLREKDWKISFLEDRLRDSKKREGELRRKLNYKTQESRLLVTELEDSVTGVMVSLTS